MRIINKLKALLFREENVVSIDLSAAEIKAGRAYLHPKSDRMKTYIVKSRDIEIRLKNENGLKPEDVVALKKKENTNNLKQERKGPPDPADDGMDRFRKRTFSITLYQEEYDALMKRIQEYGYKKAEFVIACASTATPGTMDRTHKKNVKVRKEIRQEERAIKARNKERAHAEDATK